MQECRALPSGQTVTCSKEQHTTQITARCMRQQRRAAMFAIDADDNGQLKNNLGMVVGC